MIGPVRPCLAMVVDHPAKVGEARRRAADLADQLGFDETLRARVALVVTEAATNLVKHASRGEIVLEGRAEDTNARRLDVLAVDRGPGMDDLGRCLADGYSTAGSMGTGLGAIARMADDFAIHSGAGAGTVVWAGFGPDGASTADGLSLDLGVVSVPAPGEVACGDEWGMLDRDDLTLLLVVDGLGHGPPAAEAAAAAVAAFRMTPTDDPGEIVAQAHAALRDTRGAALAVARLDRIRNEVRFAGVGNISGAIVDRGNGRTTRMVSQNGTAGHAVRKIRVFDYAWPEGAPIILHSDGVDARWDIARYPGLSPRHPALFAGLLYRDHRRPRDDATVVVASRR